MSAPDVLLATSAAYADLMDDERPLLEALAVRGIGASPAVWNDPAVDWSAARMVVIRNLFDYTQYREQFCDWAERVEAVTRLHNPARVVRWNSHKSYLLELDAAGVPIVPTEWVAAGSDLDLAALLADRGWSDAVVKPAVGNGARDAVRVTSADLAPGRAHVAALLPTRDLMIQPFVAATEGPGERAMIFFDGRFSHAIRKDQMLAGRAFSLDRTPLVDPEPGELALAERVLSLIPESPLLYARVDAVTDGHVVRLMELEVIEPVLFFSKAPGSAERMADAVAGRL